jgi:hypothetical protein
MSKTSESRLRHSILKDKQRKLRDGFEKPLTLRVHRALSWLGRAEDESDDLDVCFVLLWIGFNAMYAADIEEALTGERDRFKAFFATLVALDRDDRIYDVVWKRFPNEIRLLLNNKFVFSPFWAHQNGVPGYKDWAERLSSSQRAINAALARHDTPRILSVIFDRLYVLRNQLIHGGATWNSSANRDQVRDGAAVLRWLLPIFIDIMMDHPEQEWGMPHYPVIDSADGVGRREQQWLGSQFR